VKRVSRSLVLGALCAGLALAVTTFAHGASADDDPCAAPDVRNDIRPEPNGPPTKVHVGIRLIDMMEVNDVQQTLTADLGVVLRWTDPRLATLQGCEIKVDDIWSPGIDFANAGREFPTRPKEAGIGPGGEVTYVQRYYATLATHHNLREFPFDDQTFRISMRSLEWADSDVELVVDEQTTGRREVLNISDWQIGSIVGVVSREYGDVFDEFYSRYDLEINAERNLAYYIWKVLLPLCLIVAMSWAVFWLDPAHFGPQIGLSATSMLTLIAFTFATTNMVPELGYFTRLDVFTGGSTILVFLALVQSVFTARLVAEDKTPQAARVDRWSRVAYPIAFASLFLLS